MNYSLCDCIFWFICSTVRLVRILLFLEAGNVFKLIRFFFEKFINFFLIFNYPLSNDLTMLYHWTFSWILWWISLSFLLSIMLSLWTRWIRSSIFRFPNIGQIRWRLYSFINFFLFFKSLIIAARISFKILFQVLWILFSQFS